MTSIVEMAKQMNEVKRYWFFTTSRAEAHDNVGYKDSVEPLFTADQMRDMYRRGIKDASA